MINVSDKMFRENQNTHFILSNIFFPKTCHLLDNVEKYGRAGQATDGSLIGRMRTECSLRLQTHAQYMKHYCFSTAEIITLQYLGYTYTASFFFYFTFM